MSEELKPCGSCGSAEAEIGIIGGATFWVECSACGACSSSHDDEYDAIAAWNRRVVTPAQVEALASFLWMEQGSPPQAYINQAQACLRAAGFEVENKNMDGEE